MTRNVFLILVVVFLLGKSGVLPEPVAHIIEQTTHVMFGILIIVVAFLVAPAWVGLLSIGIVSIWLFTEQLGDTGGNANGNSGVRGRHDNIPECLCCDREDTRVTGRCIVVTGHTSD